MAASLTSATVEKRWNLLDRLKANLAFLLVADLLFLIALIAGQSRHRDVLQTIGKNSAPSVIAAQHIKAALADMDAEAANELLAKPGQGKDAAKAYDAHREEAADALIAAAENINHRDAQREPIKELQIGLGTYETRIERALDFHERNDPQAIRTYRQAATIMDGPLFEAADTLDRANFSELENAFEIDRNIAGGTRDGIIATGMILLGLLLWVQWDLAQRVRRLLNPGLLSAAIITLALLSSASAHLSRSAEDLRIAKQDAFNSLHALWQARAVAYAANADESKYLLQEDGHSDEDRFFRKAAQVSLANSTGQRGFLEKEMANIPFPGEREVAQETIDKWQTYLKIDSRIRQLKRNKDYAGAVALCLGKNQDQSDWAFDQFNDALMRTIKINQDAFDRSVASGFAELDKFDLIASIGAAAIAICCAIGLLIRIREFL